MVKAFLAEPALLDGCCEKLFKVMVTEGQQGFTGDDARRFVEQFLLKQIFEDRDEEVKRNRQLKPRPQGVPDIDRDENFWRQQIDESVKDTGVKATKNNREQLNKYLTGVLTRI